jgi:hypothetical protein
MNALVQYRDFDEVQRVSKAMVASGYFKDAADVAKAITKIMAGQEMGLGPFSSMTGIHIIKGKPVLGANLIATLIKNDPRYDYRILKLDNDGCSIAFFENGKQVGESGFTADDAKAAGLAGDNWRKFPRNMYFARAISNGAKWYTPGVFGGSPVYTPDELGADIDEDGYVTVVDVEPEPPSPNGPEAQPEPGPGTRAKPIVKNGEPVNGPPVNGNLADLKAWLEEKVTVNSAGVQVVKLGLVADAAVMGGEYDDREHVRNTLKMEDSPFPDDYEVDFRKVVKLEAGAFKILEWLLDRKAVDVDAVNEELGLGG